MEKVLLSAKQAAELSLEKGYEWFKNQIFKQIRETAERGESELHWGISYPFLKDYLEDTCDTIFSQPSIGNIYITNIRQKTSLQDAFSSLNLVLQSIEDDMPEDFFSIDLMNAYQSLGNIIGESVEDDLVNEIFSKVCMGK